MRILGIDPGFGRIGWGIVEKQASDWQVVAYGCIETSAKDDFVSRIDELNKQLKKIIEEFKPDLSAVEELFFYKNLKTAIKVGQARGVILLTLCQAKIPIEEFTPLQIKQALTGYGRAEKTQIQYMVNMILKLNQKKLQDDAADALAVALTAGQNLKYRELLNKSKVSG